MKCKSCGTEIDEGEYEVFGGRCFRCDEVETEMRDELNREEAGE